MRWQLSILLFLSTPAFAQLKADFSAANTQGCTSLNVQFTDKSAGNPTEWFWNFGDGSTLNQQNANHTYTIAGTYTVRLIVKNTLEQDYVEKINYIKVFATPQPGFITNIDSGCLPLAVSFTDTSNLAKIPVKSWFWDFGDGSTSGQQNPNYTYTTEGSFNVSLTIQTTDGCSSTFRKNSAIHAGLKPKANFNISPLTGCASVLRQFTNTSSGNPTSVLWDFGDRYTSDRNAPLYHYQDTGWFAVKLVASRYGCKDSLIKPNYVHVSGPVAKIAKDVTCSDRFTINFKDISISGISRNWDFDDGNTSGSKSVSHTYAAQGQYVVKLKVTEPGCSDILTIPVNINTTKPVVSALPQKNAYCRGDSIQLIFSNFDTANANAFAWNFDNGDTLGYKTKNDTAVYTYTINGKFKPIGFFRDNDRCIDTVALTNFITVVGPDADFQNILTGCTNTNVSFKDKSAPDVQPINQWLWDYGDGSFASGINSPVYKYSFPGTYNVHLTIQDGDGCTDTVSHSIDIFQTPVVKAGADTLLCAGSQFTLAASGANQYSWQTNNQVICNNCNNTVVSPGTAITYYVTGNSNGCTDDDSISIKVQAKESISAFPASAAICTGDSVQFAAAGTDFISWLPDATLSSTKISNPVALPLASTVYRIVGKDSNDCFTDTASVNVLVTATPVVQAAADTFLCAGNQFTLTASGANQYSWQTNGTVICNNCSNPLVSPSAASTYYVTGNSNGCTAVDSINVRVQARESVTVQPSNIILCTNDFVKTVQLNATGTDFYSWLPDATLSNTNISNPLARPSATTVYTVVGKDINNCFTDSAYVNVTVQQAPSINIANKMVQLPSGSQYMLQAAASTDVQTWQWIPAAGLSCSNCSNSIATITNNITYILTVSNSAGCSSTDSITITSLCNNDILFVPNTFSPNNDGMNDYFFPNSRANVTIKSLRVYNRWGQEVFERKNFTANDYSKGWNGKYNNIDQKEDVYVYVMELVCSNGKAIIRKGNVSLIR